jgi:hypothetical protein
MKDGSEKVHEIGVSVPQNKEHCIHSSHRGPACTFGKESALL